MGVGLSMPSLFSGKGEDTMEAKDVCFHVVAVTLLMIVGKLFLIFCYSNEADFRTRLGLGLGMCPRGEVGAGVIVISLSLGLSGPPVTVAVICLAINLVLSAGFILAVKRLALPPTPSKIPRAGRRRRTWLAVGLFLLQQKPVGFTSMSSSLAVRARGARLLYEM